jgi:hypothetical protein
MFNLGTPSDTLADFFSHGEESNPIKSIGSFVGESINPLYTAIPDLIGGQDALSGKHITDTSDYLDQLVPGANQISALSGTSVTGTLGNVLGGTAGPMLDPQRATAVNGKTAWWNQNLANFMSGLQIQDTEYPSYRRLAGKSSGG